MSFKKTSFAAPIIVLAACLGAISPLPAFAVSTGHPQCGPRLIAQNIKDAVLAYKATQYCLGTPLPFTQDGAMARIDSLRCGPQSSALIDSLMSDYEQAYKNILKRELTQTVCKQAALITFE